MNAVSDFDGIIVGGGHNGLTCAAYLAKAGLSVAVVERNPVTGGGCSTQELTLPGFRHNSHSNYHFIEEGPVPADLELHRHGSRYIYPDVQLFSPLDIERHCVNMVRGSHHVGAYEPGGAS